jgi:hypothetical protein
MLLPIYVLVLSHALVMETHFQSAFDCINAGASIVTRNLKVDGFSCKRMAIDQKPASAWGPGMNEDE